mgnify:CR=1 FL=1
MTILASQCSRYDRTCILPLRGSPWFHRRHSVGAVSRLRLGRVDPAGDSRGGAVVGDWALLTRSYGGAHGEHPLLCLTAGGALRLSREAQSATAGPCLDRADTLPRDVCPLCHGDDGSRIKLKRRTLPLRSQSYLSTLADGAPNFSLHWTGSSRFSLVPMGTLLAAAPGQ